MTPEDENRIVVCRLVVPLPSDYPTYHRAIPASHPDLHFDIMSRMVSGKEVMEDIHVSGTPFPEGLEKEFRRAKGVRSADVLQRSPQAATYRITMEMTPGTKIYTGLSIPLRYPISIDGGVAHMLIVATNQKVRDFYESFLKVAPRTTIVAIRQSVVEGAESLLTPRQQELFKLAMDSGYWDTPRRVTLTQLAELKNVAKSTLAESLAQVEKKLLYEVRDQHMLAPLL